MFNMTSHGGGVTLTTGGGMGKSRWLSVKSLTRRVADMMISLSGFCCYGMNVALLWNECGVAME